MQTKLPKKATATATTTATTTATAPSSTRRWASATGAAEKDDDAASSYRQQPVPRPDEPNLFNIPTDFHPVYRPLLPLLLNLVVVIISMFLSAIHTWERLTWLDPLMSVRAGTRTWNI